jgi:flagellar basal-body rod modification protein FlgD
MVDAVAGVMGGMGMSSAGAASMSGADKDTFLKLLTAQLSNQDPLNPMDNTAFVAQLAQFSALEQAIETNTRLAMISVQQSGIANTAVASLVGREVTVKGSSVTLSGQGVGTQVGYTLDGDATSVKLTIRDEHGTVVRTLDQGAQKAGLQQVGWDGRDDGGNPLPKGNYSVTVEAKNESGSPVSVTQETTATLVSVSFDKGYPELHLSNGVTAAASDLIRVAGETIDTSTKTTGNGS